ncbi:MAG: 1,4-alpha-glucan branching protein domain-containing protein [Elusimicrobiota bacterium]
MYPKGKEKGYWCLVLHAHLPFVRHPEYEDFLEEDWLYEAITETYLPFVDIFDRLLEENIDYRVTLSISPPLMNMLTDELLMSRYLKKLDKLVELTEKELVRTKFLPEFQDTVKMYHENLQRYRSIFRDKYGCNILTAFKKFQDAGKIEVITCCATHGFLPLATQKQSVKAQVFFACDTYERHFGRRPRGMWLSECAYVPGVDEVLVSEGIRFFFLEAHGVLYATPRPKYGVFAPVFTPSGAAVFARDIESAQQVWSAEIGYPGDVDYREFYRDVGYDLEYDYIKSYLHNDGVRRNVGLKYFRVSGKVPLSKKEPYNPAWAREKAASHAGNFMFNREKQIEHLASIMDRKPIVVSPYDAELYGHWWFEGPMFLEYLFRKMYHDQGNVLPVTPIEYLKDNPANQIVQPAASSWGDKGYFEVWLNGTNDWIYRHLHAAQRRMVEVAELFNDTTEHLQVRVLNQMVRELLLAESSDWPFIMATGTMVEYANKRITDHLVRFNELYYNLKNDRINTKFLEDLEWKDNIFPNADYKKYTRKKV